MMKLSKSSCDKMMPCSLGKIVFELLCEPLAASKPCAATIAVGVTPSVLRKVTLSLGAFSPPRVQTSCHQSGKALTR